MGRISAGYWDTTCPFYNRGIFNGLKVKKIS